jgi:pyruvate dehydrogenase kinase 2/3/4
MMQGSRLLCKAQRCCHQKLFSRQSLSTLASVEQHVLPNDEMMTDEVAELVEEYTKKKQTSASLDTLMRTGRGELLDRTRGEEFSFLDEHLPNDQVLMQVASFLRKDLPVRLAHRIQDLDQVPSMRDMPSVQKVKNVYIDSFLALTSQSKIRSPEEEAEFATLLENLYSKHSNVLMQMAQGAYELREAVKNGQIDGNMCAENSQLVDFENFHECHKFLDRFYSSRIGIRVLAGQYLALREEPMPNYVGMIGTHTSPYELVQHAARDATFMCERRYNIAPHVEIKGSLGLTFPYFPTHLHYILLELLKNAMRATVENHEGIYTGTLPPIRVIIADGTENEDVVIKVSDEGGGISRSQMDKIWSYLYTTASPTIQQDVLADHCNESPIAGLGYGLPISRAYVRYFGGDLDIKSMEGHGTDAFVYLKRLGNSREPLPVD